MARFALLPCVVIAAVACTLRSENVRERTDGAGGSADGGDPGGVAGDHLAGDPVAGDAGQGDPSPWANGGVGPFLSSATRGTGLTLTVEDWWEVAFDPADGATIDTWYDLELDPGRTTNLANGQAYNQYDGLFFQRTDIEGAWRPQGQDTAGQVTLVSANSVRTVVWVTALLDAPTFDFTAQQRYVFSPVGYAWIEATYVAASAATPAEINYSLSVANTAQTGLTWTHATADDEPLPLRVVTPAPRFIFHFAPMNGGTVFAGLIPWEPLPAGSQIFGVYDLTNVEYIYYHENDRAFAAGEALTRTMMLILKSDGATSAAALQPLVDDIENPPTFAISTGEPWPVGRTFSPADGASQLTAAAGGMVATLEAGGFTRAAPALRVGNWPHQEPPFALMLETQVQASGRDFGADLEPVARAYYDDGAGGVTQIADAGVAGISSNEQLNDDTVTSALEFADAGAALLLGFASPVTGLHFQVDARTPVTDATLVWSYWDGSAWTPLSGVQSSSSESLTSSGHLWFTVPADWQAHVPAGAEAVPLYYVRATRSGSDPFDPPVAIRRLTSDVLDVQLYRMVDRDVTVRLFP